MNIYVLTQNFGDGDVVLFASLDDAKADAVLREMLWDASKLVWHEEPQLGERERFMAKGKYGSYLVHAVTFGEEVTSVTSNEMYWKAKVGWVHADMALDLIYPLAEEIRIGGSGTMENWLKFQDGIIYASGHSVH